MRQIFCVLALTACGAVAAWGAIPRLIAVAPNGCTPGGDAAVEGQNLGDDSVAKLFLTAGGNDIELEVIEQSAESIKFRVPEATEHGMYNLMVQTAGPTPALMEQPVRLEVSDAESLAKKAEAARKLAEEMAKPVEPAVAEAEKQ